MTVPYRPLAGCVVNLSISESDDSSGRGFPVWQVNRLTLQVVAALFGQGASVVFGHDWREDGVMEAVYGFAREMQPPIPLSVADAKAEAEPMLHNLLPWPDTPYLPERDLERLSSTLRVEAAGLPTELHEFDRDGRAAAPQTALHRYLRARGLTFLRHRLNTACHARLCLGGRTSGSSGRYPGIIEEALLALQDNKPLYLAGFLGGATEQVVDAIEGKQIRDDFCPPNSIGFLYEQPPVKDAGSPEDRTIDRLAVWNRFTGAGRDKLAETNRLTPDENDELLHTPVVDRVIELVLIGLSRMQARALPD